MNNLSLNEIKKELYKQKPLAEYNYSKNFIWYFSAEIILDGVEEIVTFKVPVDDMGESLFNKEVPAQLLIRWLVGLSK